MVTDKALWNELGEKSDHAGDLADDRLRRTQSPRDLFQPVPFVAGNPHRRGKPACHRVGIDKIEKVRLQVIQVMHLIRKPALFAFDLPRKGWLTSAARPVFGRLQAPPYVRQIAFRSWISRTRVLTETVGGEMGMGYASNAVLRAVSDSARAVKASGSALTCSASSRLSCAFRT